MYTSHERLSLLCSAARRRWSRRKNRSYVKIFSKYLTANVFWLLWTILTSLILISSGSSQCVLHSTCESRNVRTGAVAASAPRTRDLMSPSRFVFRITRTLRIERSAAPSSARREKEYLKLTKITIVQILGCKRASLGHYRCLCHAILHPNLCNSLLLIELDTNKLTSFQSRKNLRAVNN